MISFLFNFISSKEISEPGFYDISLQSQERLIINTKNGKNSAHIFSKVKSSVEATIETWNLTNSNFINKIDDFQAVTITGEISKSQITFTSDVTLKLWLLPATECAGGANYYQTKQYLVDELTPSTFLKENVCVFSNFDREGTVKAFMERRKKQGNPNLVYMKAENSKVVPTTICNYSQCEFVGNNDGYIKYSNFGDNTTFIYKLEFAENTTTDICNRKIIPIVNVNSMEDRFFKPLRHELDCSKPASPDHSYYNFYYATGILIVLCAVCLFAVYKGWCAKLSYKVFGGNNGEPTIQNIDEDLVDDIAIDDAEEDA